MKFWQKISNYFKKSRLFLNRGSGRSVNTGQKLPKGAYLNAVEIQRKSENDFIKIVPVGKFPFHPDGNHEITKNHIQQMKNNFDNRGTELLFDFEHRSLWGDTLAAGWSNKAEARDDGLYISYPQFTNAAKGLVEDREYRYFSPVYKLNGLDKRGNKIGAVLDSVALTNRPYMDSEIDHIKNDNSEDAKMTYPKEIKEKLGLKEDATDEEVETKLNEVVEAAEKIKDEKPDPDKKDGEKKDGKEVSEDAAVANSDLLKRIEVLEKKAEADRKVEAEVLVNGAVVDGKILPADKDVYVNAAIADYVGTKKKLDERKKNTAMPGSVQTPGEKDDEGRKKNSVDAAAEYFKSQGRVPLAKQAQA